MKQIEPLAHIGKAYRVYEQIQDDEMIVLDSCRERDQETLAAMYDLTEEQAYYLHRMIQMNFEPDNPGMDNLVPIFSTVKKPDRDGWPDGWPDEAMYKNWLERQLPDAIMRCDSICECIGEALHQSLDGWSDGEKVIISLFLDDLALAANLKIAIQRAISKLI